MIELMKEAVAMGWPALGLLVALLFYFKFSITDPVANKRAVFKTFIGTLAAFLLFMAIANYKMNFFAESRLLPVSLVLITSTAFMMALYFTNLSALLKIGGFMFFICPGVTKIKVANAIASMGGRIQPFKFTEQGLITWKVQ